MAKQILIPIHLNHFIVLKLKHIKFSTEINLLLKLLQIPLMNSYSVWHLVWTFSKIVIKRRNYPCHTGCFLHDDCSSRNNSLEYIYILTISVCNERLKHGNSKILCITFANCKFHFVRGQKRSKKVKLYIWNNILK